MERAFHPYEDYMPVFEYLHSTREKWYAVMRFQNGYINWLENGYNYYYESEDGEDDSNYLGNLQTNVRSQLTPYEYATGNLPCPIAIRH